MTTSTPAPRCPAAHVADPRGCEGQPDAVHIVDQTGTTTEACLRHGAVLLASLDRGRVYPFRGPQGSAIVVYTRARELPPFDFLTGPGVGRVASTDEAAVFPHAPQPTLGEGGDTRPRGASSAHQVRGQRLDTAAMGPAAAQAGPGNGWSGPGNARSSRWWASCVARPRGNA